MNEEIMTIDSSDSLRESSMISSSSSSFADFSARGLEVEGEKGFFNGNTLSLGVKEVFGVDIFKEITEEESRIIGSSRNLIKLIAQQRIFHVSGLMREFNASRHKIYALKGVLVRRNLLAVATWSGQSKGMFGMVLYLTQDCTPNDVRNYIREYEAIDHLKYTKEQQRSKKKISTGELKEIWKEQSEAAKSIKEDAQLELQEKERAVLCEHNQHKDVCTTCYKEKWKK